MILDSQNEFSDAQAVTATAISTNVLDLGATPTLRAIHAGREIMLVISVSETALSAGATTVTFSLESDSTENLATSPTVHWVSAAIGKAALVAGANVVRIPLPVNHNFERYLGVRYTVATGPLTAGRFDAALVMDTNNWIAYPDAVN